MNKKIAALVLAASVVGGIGAGVLVHAATREEPVAASPAPSRTTPSSEGGESGMAAPDELELAPGRVGPVRAGMTKAQALSTGYFVADKPAPVEGCPVIPLAWKDEYVNTYDVYTLGNGEISSIGVHGRGVTTADGIGVGSSYDEVKAAYPDDTLLEAGYGQSGVKVFDRQDGGWIGFLFDSSVDAIAGPDPVTFVEVTKGAEPSLMRDGC
ncbi:hypothetical protein [Aeromicrobium fastidiosum]|uniref:Uncharacterized protein n=1 Tax=Aeromicrobium fastidiosum TaxID=52699 RepID=A0A641AL00_9ACTN|nr:hypothetical protein [Aeromicrobium fastidiosum]KAA1376053.1 hypothetical protein ESP62_011400 [Aeromicrobium fastidiosum]MBP2392076.1 hypothetical protein [Aeromicrobium fastidiosum]